MRLEEQSFKDRDTEADSKDRCGDLFRESEGK